jgi:L-cysteine:1D-myo-inositol 2-amino-2-deoxy-alpha-D-glucopyranoside ligase
MSIIIDVVQKHIDSGLTYALEGDIYLDLTKVDGALSSLPFPLEEALNIFRERGGDPDRNEKHHALDPLLWRAKKGNDPSLRCPILSLEREHRFHSKAAAQISFFLITS